jgi:hypothetical protein
LQFSAFKQDIQRLVDAWAVISRLYLSSDPATDRGFYDLARNYRDAPVKPALSEDARRYRVQAEAAVESKQYQDAADLYAQVNSVAPWWPEGHLNRAFLLAALNQYREATYELKRYLALVPDAPNARAMQDKIYVWEGMAK